MTTLTVTQLNQQVRTYLEYEIGEVSVMGEISGLTKPSSGHFYFTLKDAAAQVRCVYFRNRHASTAGKTVQNGQQVIIRGKLSLYEARGDYQLIVEQLEEAGQGDLYRQFELLKAKLAALGLFDAARKKSIPRIPECIGIITSATGAALQDVLTTLRCRFPLIPVIVYSSDVQGKQAPLQLCRALQQAGRNKRCDVLLLVRGGGSMEDLWAFNDENLAHAIARSPIPVVSGVGHETDFTIADFVADMRAATPTAAAEAVVPDRLEFMACLQTIQASLKTAILRFIRHRQLLLSHAMQKMASPRRLIHSHWQTLDYLQRHLQQAQKQMLAQQGHRLQMTSIRLDAKNPGVLIRQTRTHVEGLKARLIQSMNLKTGFLRQKFMQSGVTLHTVSPLATLDRGYAIATRNSHVLTDSHQVQTGDAIEVRLAKGELVCEVRRVIPCLTN